MVNLEDIPTEKMIHVLPVNDQHEHEEKGYKCMCNPKLLFENGHLIIIHKSWDGRELREEGAPIN
jgi:hypothetical protein